MKTIKDSSLMTEALTGLWNLRNISFRFSTFLAFLSEKKIPQTVRKNSVFFFFFLIAGLCVEGHPALHVRLRLSSSPSRDVTWKEATAAASSRKAASRSRKESKQEGPSRTSSAGATA